MLSLDRYLRRSFILYINILSLILVLCAGNTDSAHAESFLKTRVETVKSTNLKAGARIKQVLRNLDVPQEIGFVKDVHVPKNPSGKLIINVQDLHCNYKAQKNIAYHSISRLLLHKVLFLCLLLLQNTLFH